MENKTRTIALVAVIMLVVGAIAYLESQKASPTGASEEISANNQEGESMNEKMDENMKETQSQDSMHIRSGDDLKEPTPGAEIKNEYGIIPGQQGERKRVAEKEGKYEFAPELTGITNWLNSEQLTMADLQGKVVLVDFWTYSCINCIRTLPYITAWDQKYRDQGLVIIAVHTPEFAFEKIPENVDAAIQKYNIEYPVAMDNDYRTWRAYENRYWPRKYLIDKDGYIRYDHIGEGGYAETETWIQELLLEIGVEKEGTVVDIEEQTPTTRNTPELYAGYEFALPRGQNVGNSGGLKKDSEKEYSLPNQISSDKIYLQGNWRSNPDDLEAKGDASIVLRFKAKSVNIVAEATEAQEVNLLVDGESITEQSKGKDTIFPSGFSRMIVQEPRLYNVFNSEYGERLIEIQVQDGFKFNAFTFG